MSKPFDFYHGIQLTEEMYDFFLDDKNYTQNFPKTSADADENYGGEDDIQWLKLTDIKEAHLEFLDNVIPKGVIPEGSYLEWDAALYKKGYKLPPHTESEDTTRDGDPRVAIGKFILWVTRDSFKGRDFAYGRLEGNIDATEKSTSFSWDDPRLIEEGRIHPKNGDACYLRLDNPNYYHGVTELLSNAKVCTISTFIFI